MRGKLLIASTANGYPFTKKCILQKRTDKSRVNTRAICSLLTNLFFFAVRQLRGFKSKNGLKSPFSEFDLKRLNFADSNFILFHIFNALKTKKSSKMNTKTAYFFDI